MGRKPDRIDQGGEIGQGINHFWKLLDHAAVHYRHAQASTNQFPSDDTVIAPNVKVISANGNVQVLQVLNKPIWVPKADKFVVF